MKNKEIEELLNKMKNCNGVFDYYLEYGEVDLLLSYIEQLEKENKILRKNAEHNDKVVDKVNWENQQLKKERASIMTSLTTSREKYNNDKARYRRKYKNLKKQKDDIVEYLKKWGEEPDADMYIRIKEYKEFKDLLRMLGEIE